MVHNQVRCLTLSSIFEKVKDTLIIQTGSRWINHLESLVFSCEDYIPSGLFVLSYYILYITHSTLIIYTCKTKRMLWFPL